MPGTSIGQALAQFRGERRELGVRRVQHGEVLRGEGVLFDRHEVQARAALRVLAPGLPGGEEGQAEAEAGLEDGEAPRPAQRAGRPLPSRNTWCACARPPCAL